MYMGFEKATLRDLYEMSTYRGMGNTLWYDYLEEILKRISKLLSEKYPIDHYKMRFVNKLILKAPTHEIDVEDEEWLRSLLHNEVYPEERTESIDTLKMIMEGKQVEYP